MFREDWRSRAAYDYATTMEAPGLAWEFLRRNPDYRADYEIARAEADDGAAGPARCWGLRFSGGSKPTR
jgi:hypothetical protein